MFIHTKNVTELLSFVWKKFYCINFVGPVWNWRVGNLCDSLFIFPGVNLGSSILFIIAIAAWMGSSCICSKHCSNHFFCC